MLRPGQRDWNFATLLWIVPADSSLIVRRWGKSHFHFFKTMRMYCQAFQRVKDD